MFLVLNIERIERKMQRGPLLEKLNIVGNLDSVVGMQAQNGRWVYLFGETHNAAYIKKNDIVDHVFKYCQSKPVTYIIENDSPLQDDETILMLMRMNMNDSDYMDGPIMRVRKTSLTTQSLIRIKDLDARIQPPFHLLWNTQEDTPFPERASTDFLRELIPHIRNRKDIAAFLRGLILPTEPPVEWFADIAKKYKIPPWVGKGNIRKEMIRLNRSDPDAYNLIDDYISSIFEQRVGKNKNVSPVLEWAAAELPDVGTKYINHIQRPLEAIFVPSLSVLCDVQALIQLQMELTTDSMEPIVIHLGHAHVESLAHRVSMMARSQNGWIAVRNEEDTGVDLSTAESLNSDVYFKGGKKTEKKAKSQKK